MTDTRQVVWPPIMPAVQVANIDHTPRKSYIVISGFQTYNSVGASEENSPAWLQRVEQRIINSIAKNPYQLEEEPGRWLSDGIAKAGLIFLRNAKNLLPSEPHIYSSREGSLVAEFTGDQGTLTALVSADSITLFTSTETGFFEKVLSPSDDKNGSMLRDELRTITKILTGQHVSMESSD